MRSIAILFSLAAALGVPLAAAFASSHMDAPLITLDPAANTTDVYAFVDQDGDQKSLVVAVGVYPHEEPGIGPNKYNFDDNVLYEIHIATGEDLQNGDATLSYQFRFKTKFANKNTILQSYLGVIENVPVSVPESGDPDFDPAQNLRQTYTVTKVDHRRGAVAAPWLGGIRRLGRGVVPPNNQGIATPFYNQENDGENPARGGVATETELDRYTRQSIAQLDLGYESFAGQRDDGFYADIQSIFDLLSLRNPGEDSQGGFNVHMMALRIPIRELGGDRQIVGVYATTSRRKVSVLRGPRLQSFGDWVQVGRQGNPLFNEAFVAIADKDAYSRTSPSSDRRIFEKYALEPELAALINALLLGGTSSGIAENRTDIAGIYIPDLIKCDLSTPGVHLAGGGPKHPTNPDDSGFSRLSVFGGDVLQSRIQDPFQNGGFIPGGWPNGRRFGDDVVDIAINAVLSDLRVVPPVIRTFEPGDGVSKNDIPFNKVFPYAATPLNGRRHAHP